VIRVGNGLPKAIIWQTITKRSLLITAASVSALSTTNVTVYKTENNATHDLNRTDDSKTDTLGNGIVENNESARNGTIQKLGSRAVNTSTSFNSVKEYRSSYGETTAESIGGIFGGILFFCLIIGSCYKCCKKKKPVDIYYYSHTENR